ncbi:MAG: hypothetical protein DPW18_18470 [Chloroflexi bacterium]|nr:hypothetical protein [Chloroflexota bacterium]MDL1944262.1 cbb3-type cytochrome c oxidase subunit I [Chloroflexi bacterium CFX2]
MPRLSVWFVRASLIYLLAGFAFGALILAEKGISYFPSVWYLFPVHVEFLLIGWMVQLAMGVSFWILPRFMSGPPRGNETLIWMAFLLVNAGILLVAIQAWLPFAASAGRILEAAGVLVYILGTWRRVKPYGT